MEQRVNIKFCFKTGRTASKTFRLIKQANSDSALSRTWVFEWHARFQDGCETRRSTAIRTPDMIETVRELISTDHRMTLRMMEEKLEISRETICKILMEHLGKRKICARFVLYSLTNEQKALRLQACQEFIQSVDDDRSLLDSVVMGDETWCFQYDPQTKRQSMEWHSLSSPRQKISVSKVKKQSDVGHILRQLGYHSQIICSTRSDGE
jgi:hypothetical protein